MALAVTLWYVRAGSHRSGTNPLHRQLLPNWHAAKATGGSADQQEATMSKLHPSISGLSILMALALGLWEYYFFFFGGNWEGPLGWFTPNRLGFNLAWLTLFYISFQLLSIPFALRTARGRFIVGLDGMAAWGVPAITI